MHAIEKILAKAAGKRAVVTGEIINCKVDMAGINDLYLQTLRSFFEMGGKKVNDPDKVIVFLDHYAPASTITQADNQKQFREFCWDQGIGLLMDVDQGVCHQIMAAMGLSYPGEVIVITDSHTTTHGAFGAFGTTGCHFFNETHPAYRRIQHLIAVRQSYPSLRYGRQYLRQVRNFGAPFALPAAGELVAWSRVLDEEEVLCVVNGHGAESRGGDVVVDGALNQGAGSFVVIGNTAEIALGAAYQGSYARGTQVPVRRDGCAYLEVRDLAPSEVLVLINKP